MQPGTLEYVPPNCLYCKVYEDAPVTLFHETVMPDVVMPVGGEFSAGAVGKVYALTWLLQGESPEELVALTWKPYCEPGAMPLTEHNVPVVAVQLETLVHEEGVQPEGARHSNCKVYVVAPVMLFHESVMPAVVMPVGEFSVGADGTAGRVVALTSLLHAESPEGSVALTSK